MFNSKIYRTVLFLILFFSGYTIFAQKSNAKIDSITKIIDRGYYTGNFNHQTTLKNTTELYYLSQEAGFIHGKLRSIVEEANIYCSNADFESALKKINEGIDLAKSENDYNILFHLSIVYQRLVLQLGDSTRAKQILAQSESYNKLVDNNNEKQINAIFILLSKAELLVNNEGLTKNMAPVLAYKKEAYSRALKLHNSNKYKKFIVIYTLESLAWSTALAEDIPNARKYASEIDDLLKTYPNEDLILQNLIIKGAIENIAENYYFAIKYLSAAISRAKENHNVYKLYEVYPMISASYGQLKDFENATIYSWRHKYLEDSISIVKEKIRNSEINNKINIKINNPKKNAAKDFSAILATALILLILLIAGYLFYKKNKKKLIHQVSKKDARDEKNTITDTTIPSDTELEVVKKLVDLAKSDINVFYVEFQKNYPTFYHSLKKKHPELNISDINFCALIKMNFEIKQISVYTNSTIRSVESRRYRIIKKMQLKSQSELYIILSELS